MQYLLPLLIWCLSSCPHHLYSHGLPKFIVCHSWFRNIRFPHSQMLLINAMVENIQWCHSNKCWNTFFISGPLQRCGPSVTYVHLRFKFLQPYSPAKQQFCICTHATFCRCIFFGLKSIFFLLRQVTSCSWLNHRRNNQWKQSKNEGPLQKVITYLPICWN